MVYTYNWLKAGPWPTFLDLTDRDKLGYVQARYELELKAGALVRSGRLFVMRRHNEERPEIRSRVCTSYWEPWDRLSAKILRK